MKLLIAVTTLALAVAAQDIIECPYSEGKLPSATGCKDYYVCKDYVPTLHTCPKRQHFNPKTNACMAPELANCTLDLFECRSDEGRYPDPSDCSNSFDCFNRYPFARPCPPGTWYDPISEICDSPWAENCTIPHP
ncbi:hypothetical protein BGX27_009861 [Mortierella sp. AM989]|nr:hypothetical protein BGX27_009861 [Mortierella sp. AM989]